jgi:hypothetical protein
LLAYVVAEAAPKRAAAKAAVKTDMVDVRDAVAHTFGSWMER